MPKDEECRIQFRPVSAEFTSNASCRSVDDAAVAGRILGRVDSIAVTHDILGPSRGRPDEAGAAPTDVHAPAPGRGSEGCGSTSRPQTLSCRPSSYDISAAQALLRRISR